MLALPSWAWKGKRDFDSTREPGASLNEMSADTLSGVKSCSGTVAGWLLLLLPSILVEIKTVG